MNIDKMNIGELSDNGNTWNYLTSFDNPHYVPRIGEQLRLKDKEKGFIIYVVMRVMSTFYSAKDVQIDIDVIKLKTNA